LQEDSNATAPINNAIFFMAFIWYIKNTQKAEN